MAAKMTTMERSAWELWVGTLDGYAKFTLCDGGCGEVRHCRSAHGTRYLCLECFDQGAR